MHFTQNTNTGVHYKEGTKLMHFTENTNTGVHYKEGTKIDALHTE